jgi:alpha-galactosidase
MTKITIVGAGSMVFARDIVSDVLSFPEFADVTLALMDIDPDRLERTTWAAERMVEKAGLDATVESTTDRRDALDGADYVVNMINVGSEEPFVNEIRIPEEYGVKQAIGDTLGPGGVFRALRTIPVVLDIARDIEEVCPDAVLLNYTNPMAVVCWAVDEATDVETVGLCHSVPHTVEAIADYVGAPAGELDYWVAGINHMAWFLTCEWNGEDVYPLLAEAMRDEETYERDTVRFEILRHFGAFVTESSHHMSEYVPYFRTDQETIDRMAGTDYAERVPTASYLEGWLERSRDRDETDGVFEEEDLVIERSEEYAARIVHSLESGEPRRFNLNVSNDAGLVRNLPEDACVEVPCFVDGAGIHPCAVGSLPPQLAALNRSNVAVQERTVTAALENDRDALFQAVKLDPLTAAVLPLDEIHEMTEELLEANREYLPALS